MRVMSITSTTTQKHKRDCHRRCCHETVRTEKDHLCRQARAMINQGAGQARSGCRCENRRRNRYGTDGTQIREPVNFGSQRAKQRRGDAVADSEQHHYD